MQNTPNFDEPLPLNSFVLYQKSSALQFSDKLKLIRNGPYKFIIKPTEDRF